jgi:hypothetical protein
VRFRLGGWPEVWTVPLDGDGGTGEPAAVLAGSYGWLRHAADDDRVLRFPRA